MGITMLVDVMVVRGVEVVVVSVDVVGIGVLFGVVLIVVTSSVVLLVIRVVVVVVVKQNVIVTVLLSSDISK